MAEVRCLFCGKNNPPTAEKCQFCGERLVTDSSTSHEGGESDWLSGLRGGNWDESNVPAEEPPADATANTEFPDWLNRVRARSDEDQKTPESAEPAGDDLDWLAGLGAAPAQSEGSADDWLNTLNSPVQPPSGQPEANFDSKPSEPSSDDWMKNLSDWNTPGEPVGEQPSAAEPAPDFNFFAEETPAPAQEPDWFNVAQEAPSAPAQDADWLSAASSLPSTPPAEPASTDMPDWLRQLNQTAPPPETPQAETPEIEIPDWLSSSPAQVAPAQPEPPATEAELPDWLAGFTGTAAVAADAAAEPAAPETPDWLSAGLPAQPSAEPAVPDLFDQTGIAAANEVQPDQPAPDFAFLSESSEPVKESLPDFSALFADEPAAGDAGSGAPPADLPDFSALSGFDEAQPSSQPPAIPGAEEEKPDLNLGSVLGALGAAGIAAASAAASAASQPEEPAQPQAETPEEMPDWLSSFGEAEAEPSGEPLTAAPAELSSPFVDEELPDWLGNIAPTAGAASSVSPLIEQPETVNPADLTSPFQVELPDWLESEESAESPAVMEAAPEEGGEELAKAELPAWVEDLRPLEAVIPGSMLTDTSEGVVEKAGPLAGMRGVLQSEDLTAAYRKPPVYSARLRVSERQRSQATILENLIGLETTPKDIPSIPSRAPQVILRVFIALLLILSMLTMLLPDFRLTAPAAAAQPGMSALYNLVDGLPDNAPVLLAFDYEPGFSGEMRYAANSVIENLMVKNARLAIVSTSATGPMLADELLKEVRTRRADYSLDMKTVNLGYLPGGTTSLIEFAQNPRGATPTSLDTPLTGVPAWDHPAVAGITNLQDFALVIVLTDTPEVGRAWVEQVQPLLGGVPLGMIASAQAGPLLIPYYDSAQISGLLSGLEGGVLYEQATGRVNLANRFWGSYQTGALAGLVLLIIGGIISAVMGISGRKPARKGKA